MVVPAAQSRAWIVLLADPAEFLLRRNAITDFFNS